MIELVYDDTWEGFLSAVFEAFVRQLRGRQTGVSVVSRRLARECCLFSRQEVQTDPQKAERVSNGMRKLSPHTPERVYTVWLSEEAGIDDLLVAYLRVGFDEGIDPDINRLHPAVAKVLLMDRRVAWEAHRMLQFVRFTEAREGVYVADIRPQYRVLPLIGDHFCKRFGDQRLLIRDMSRKTVLVSDGQGWSIHTLPENEPLPPLPQDGAFESLWRDYFKVIANPARKNLRLQQQFVPLKYREFLTEFHE